MHKVAVPSHIAAVVKRVQDHGHSCYVVGGPVRDSVLGRPVKDWDLATSATLAEMARIYPGHAGQTRYGTTLVRAGSETVEVTTFRTEAEYTDHRRPDVVEFTSDIGVDLSRRDFTMNAMAYDPVSGRMVDPFGGMADIAARRIRAVGLASERFGEDALRMLRAVRFSAQIGFPIERETFEAIKRAAPTARHLARERVGGELAKMLAAPYAPAGFEAMADAGLFEPSLGVVAERGVRHGIRLMAALREPDAIGRAAALLHHADGLSARGVSGFSSQDAYGLLLSVGVGDDAAESVSWRIEVATAALPQGDAALARAMGRHGPDLFLWALGLRRACAADSRSGTREVDAAMAGAAAYLASGRPVALRQLALNGDDLVAAGIKPGPAMGRLLDALFDEVASRETRNEREALLGRARALSAP